MVEGQDQPVARVELRKSAPQSTLTEVLLKVVDGVYPPIIEPGRSSCAATCLRGCAHNHLAKPRSKRLWPTKLSDAPPGDYEGVQHNVCPVVPRSHDECCCG